MFGDDARSTDIGHFHDARRVNDFGRTMKLELC